MKHFYLLILPVIVLCTTSCMEIDVNVKMNEDQSCVITERVKVFQRILDQKSPSGKSFKQILTKETALKRAKQLGKGCTLAEFSVKKTADGSLEAVSRYTMQNINNIRLFPPFLGKYGHEKGHIQVKIQPCYQTRWASPDEPGYMVAILSTHGFAKPPKPDKGKKAGEKPKLTPAEVQKLRDLIPVFQEACKGFRFRMTFEGYNPLRGGNVQYPRWETMPGSSVPSRKKILVDISSESINRFSQRIFDNEEIMLSIFEDNMFVPQIRDLFGKVSSRSNGLYDTMLVNPGFPIIFYDGLHYYNERRAFLPSEYHYKQYFDGKPKKYGGNR